MVSVLKRVFDGATRGFSGRRSPQKHHNRLRGCNHEKSVRYFSFWCFSDFPGSVSEDSSVQRAPHKHPFCLQSRQPVTSKQIIANGLFVFSTSQAIRMFLGRAPPRKKRGMSVMTSRSVQALVAAVQQGPDATNFNVFCVTNLVTLSPESGKNEAS